MREYGRRISCESVCHRLEKSPLKIAIGAPADIHALARFSGKSTAGVAPGLGSSAVTPLIIELLCRGHKVTLYTASWDLPAEETHEWGPLRIFVGRYRRRGSARDYYRTEIGTLKRMIEADAPEFVHAHWTYEFSIAALRSGVPTLTTIHDLPWNVLRYHRDFHRAIRLLMAYEVALRGKSFAAVSECAAAHFRRYFKPGAEIKVIPNGLPGDIFEIPGKFARSGDVGATFATVLQGWSRLKNAAVALRAFEIVRRAIPEARLYMFGQDFGQGEAAQKWATQKRLDASVMFVGLVGRDELLRRLSEEVDILVHPSLDESFSMVAAEAMALRKPVLGGRSTPGVREVLGLGACGVLVDVTDPAEIAQGMILLARDASYRNEVVTRGLERASRLYRLEVAADEYERCYRRLLKI